MALGQIENDTRKKIYLSVSHGKIVHYIQSGGIEYFKNVSGQVKDVYLKNRVFNGQLLPFWYIDIMDGEDIYSISLPFASGTFKSIILSLASFKKLTDKTLVVVEPYELNGYTKVCVYADGKKLDWIKKTLPPLKRDIFKGKEIIDDTDRMNYISDIANQVKNRVNPTV